MGIYMSLCHADNTTLGKLQREPLGLSAFYDAEYERRATLYLDKSWAAIIWLFRQMFRRTPTDCGHAWLLLDQGGDVLPHDWMVRVQDVETVSILVDLLESVSDARFRKMLKPAEMAKARVYPSIIWERDGRSAQDYVMLYLAKLRAFLAGAVGHNVIVIGGYDQRPRVRHPEPGLLTQILDSQPQADSDGPF